MLTKAKKVYCKDCEYIKHVVTHEPTWNASFFGCKIENYTPFSGFRDCKVKNNDGSCPDYKRKWYLLWR